MYEERKEKFSIRTIIIQILLIVLVVFLLLWLFPSKSYVKDYANNAFTDKLQPLYSQIFNQNITTMKEAAITYFTTDRLPSKVDDNVTMTLKEMQEKKLVLDLIDSNNNKCDVNESYVKIVKEKTEYLMIVNLKCSDKTDSIEVHLGCYDYCGKNGICEKKEETKPTTPVKPVVTKKYIYEYEKITDGVWGPWGPWSKWTTNETTKTDYRNVETKIEKVSVGTKDELVGYDVQIATHTLETEIEGYKCPTGYTTKDKVVTANSICTKPITSTETAKTVISGYKCPTGYTTKDKTVTASSICTKPITSTETAKTIISGYKCPTGYTTEDKTVTANSKCTKPITTFEEKKSELASTNYSDWVYQGKYTYNSIQYSSETRKVVRVSSSINTNCTTNCTENTYTYYVYTRSISKIYKCPTGYTTKDKVVTASSICTKPITSTETAKTIISGYKCPTGYTTTDKTVTANSKCTKPVTTTSKRTTQIISFVCPTGYTTTDKTVTANSKCTKPVTTEKTTKAVISGYKCPTGYTTEDKVVTASSKCTSSAISQIPKYEKVTIYEDVTYYRTQTREFISGDRATKWSTSKNDKALLEQDYVLTGNKKEIK